MRSCSCWLKMTVIFDVQANSVSRPWSQQHCLPDGRAKAGSLGASPRLTRSDQRKTSMLTKMFPFLDPVHITRALSDRLQALAKDCLMLEHDLTFVTARLRTAPMLDSYVPVLSPLGLHLVGQVTQHPLLGSPESSLHRSGLPIRKDTGLELYHDSTGWDAPPIPTIAIASSQPRRLRSTAATKPAGPETSIEPRRRRRQ